MKSTSKVARFNNYSASCFKIFASRINVPKGRNEDRKAIKVLATGHFLWKCTMVSKITNAVNNKPCAIPVILTGNGTFIQYFNGMAINKSTKKETPSSKAINLNVFIIEGIVIILKKCPSF